MDAPPDPAVMANSRHAELVSARGTVVFADIVESVRLFSQDASGTAQRWQALLEALTQRVLPGTRGRLVKSLGDGLMLLFDEPRKALEAVLRLQSECDRLECSADPRRRIWLRIGVHAGEYLAGPLDVYGSDVNIAARLAALAGPGEILVSGDVQGLAGPGLPAQMDDLGDCWLKNFPRPVRTYRLGPPGPAPVVEGVSDIAGLKPLVAVIPFASRGGPSEHAVLGEIIAEEVIASLSRSREIDVVSRLSTTLLRDQSLGDLKSPSPLGADYLLTGSYSVEGDRVLLNAAIHEAREGRVVWNERLRARANALVAGRDRCIQRLIDAIGIAVTARELERARRHALPTLETFTLLIAAISLIHRLSLSEFERGRLMLDAVLERAPRRAEPHAWLAKWHVLRVHQGWSPHPVADIELARKSIGRALDLDSHCSLALAIEGLVQTSLLGQLDLGQASYEKALDVNPNDALAWLLFGTLHAFRGEGRTAVKATRHALRLSPLDPMRYYFDSLSATAALAAEDYPSAIDHARRSLRANQTHASTWRALAIAQALSGQQPEARRSIESLLRIDPGLTVSGWLARSPSAAYPVGPRWAEALRMAGLPE